MSVVFIPGNEIQLVQVESATVGRQFADDQSGYFLTAASDFSTELTNKERIALYNALIEFAPIRNALRSEGKEDLKPVSKFENTASAVKRLGKLVGLVPLYENGEAEVRTSEIEEAEAVDISNTYSPKNEPVLGIISGEGFPEGEPVEPTEEPEPEPVEPTEEPEPEPVEPTEEPEPEPVEVEPKRRGRKPKAGPKERKKRGPNGPRVPKNVYHPAAPNVVDVRAGSMQARMLELLNRRGGVEIGKFIDDCNAHMRGKVPWSTSNTWGWLVYLLKDLKGWGLERRDGRLYAFRDERERKDLLALPQEEAA